jgi:hypothetical protein
MDSTVTINTDTSAAYFSFFINNYVYDPLLSLPLEHIVLHKNIKKSK